MKTLYSKFILRPLCGFILMSAFSGAPAHSMMCREVFPELFMKSEGFIPFIQTRLGGQARHWNEGLEQILKSKSVDELILIDQIFKSTEARSWFIRRANSTFFFRVDSIFREFDHLSRVQQYDLSSLKSWDDLALFERKALLLATFKKWSWDVDSHHVMGFSRWTDASYLLSRALMGQIQKGPLNVRLHELLGSSSQDGFFSSLVWNFRAELNILKQLKMDSSSREVLIKTLGDRIEYFNQLKVSNQFGSVRSQLLDVQVLRAAVLRKMAQENRKLTKLEVEALSAELSLPANLARQIKWGQIGLNFLPNISLGMLTEMAMVSAVAYVLSEYYFQNQQDPDNWTIPFNEVITIVPLDEKTGNQ